MLLYAFHFGLLATSNSFGDVSDIISVGNPLVSWSQQPAKLPDHAVLDTGICFQTSGSVQSINGHFSERGDPSWPRFLVLEPSTSPTHWQVLASSDARVVHWGRPTRLHLLTALMVKPGTCLGWFVSEEAAEVSSVELRPFQHPWILPTGKNRDTFAAVAVTANAEVGSVLDFHRLHFRSYALMAELVPAKSSFFNYALHFQDTLRQVWQMSHAAKEMKPEDCWKGLVREMCCIPAGIGTPWCFDGLYTYELCCKGFDDPSKAAIPGDLSKAFKPNFIEKGTLSPRPQISVDLFIRTYYGKMQELVHLLQSVALFWPSDWGVLVRLDGESIEDEHACALLPSWARCSLQPKPGFLSKIQKAFSHIDPFGAVSKGLERHQGIIWKEWSECLADQYSTADFIAISDSDVVFTTFGIPQLLFQPAEGQSGIRPVIWAHADNVQFPNTVAALNLPWEAEFMDSFPLVVNRSHFQTLRRRIVSLYGEDLPQNASESEIFDGSFLRYVQRVRELSEPGGESPCFHSMIGSTLWFFHREEYVWSIRHGHLSQLPLQHTCPRLRVAQHAAYWGRENWMSYGGLPYKHLSIGGRPAVLSDVAYAARSSTLILAGLCALPWMETNASPTSLLGRRTFSSEKGSSNFQLPDLGFLEVQRDLCRYGLGLAEATSHAEDRLLARAFPAQLWTRAESSYCGDLEVEKQLEEYRQLMRRLVFTVPATPTR